jgi:hypothetical protein
MTGLQDNVFDTRASGTFRPGWTPKPRPIPKQQNKVLAFALAGFVLFAFATLMILVFIFHYATTHNVLPGLVG